MIVFKIILLLTLNISTITATMNCSTVSGNCRCIPGSRLEIQCPPFASALPEKFVIQIFKQEQVLISCYDMQRFQMNLLPSLTVGKTTKLNIRDCSLPDNFKKIIDHFSMQEVKVVHFENPPTSIILLKNNFYGLEDLQKLKLNALRFTFLERNVFEFVPNIYSLQMERNYNLKLETNIFENMTRLESLFLSNNYLSVIPDKLFHKLETLKVLQLGKNKLKVISRDIFSTLSNLKILGLKDNQMEDLSDGAFENLINLSSLDLSRNNLTSLSGNIFKNTKLSEIWLDSNPGLQPPDYLFGNLPHLTKVSLKNCNLESLPLHFFENSTNLEELDLSHNNFKRLSKLYLPNLKKLVLDKNSIDSIDENMFSSLKSLQEVNLSRNQIKRVESGLFSKNNLTRIYMTNNPYSGTVTNILQGTTNVEMVDLSHNSITEMGDIFSNENTKELRLLDLSHNNLNQLQVNDLESNHMLEMFLDFNNITIVNCNQCKTVRNVFISLTNNPITCDCKNYEFLRYVKNQKFQNSLTFGVESLNCNSLPLSNLICQLKEEQSECSYTWRPEDRAMILNCSAKNFTVFPEIDSKIIKLYEYNHTEIYLDRNRLTQGPSHNLRGYDNVTKMDLSRNKIEKIGWLPPKLQILWLNNNNLSYLDVDILNQSNLVNLTLNHNPWRCDCDSVNLTRFLLNYGNMAQVNNIYCSNLPQALVVNLNVNDVCSQWLSWHFATIFLLFFISVATALALYYRNRKSVTLFLYILFGDWCFDPDNLNKIYDAFISYSSVDEAIAINLVHKLESGPKPFKLCVHYRDFVPGEVITANITNAVMQSRRTIVILSQNFLKSVWGKTEFRTAHAEAMVEGRARVIIVMYEDVDLEELDEELKMYVEMNTYLRWGDAFFWDKLRYALLHSTMKFWEKEKVDDFIKVEVGALEQLSLTCEKNSEMDMYLTNSEETCV